MSLDEYRRKRDFKRTREPAGEATTRARRGRAARSRQSEALQFVVQKHAARNLHYDFRLELDGVLKSWAVPKGPSLVPAERRMGVQTEDHPLEYGGFEGVIPPGEYGAGSVVVWDRGYWEPIGDPHAGLEKGDLTFRLDGEKLRGRWHLVRMRPRPSDRGKATWLLIKGRDDEARDAAAKPITEAAPQSVLSGRDVDDVAREADRVWSSEHGEVEPPPQRSRRGAEPRNAARTTRPSTTPALEAPDPASIPGARRAPLPKSLAPQLATLVDAPPAGDDWLHELKLDGYRLLCWLDGGHARLLTRTGLDWTERFPPLARALEALAVESAVFDGEAVVLDAAGRSDFQALQRALSEGLRGDGSRGSPSATLRLFSFDLPYLDGYDLRRAPLVERKRALRQLLGDAGPGGPLRFSDHVQGQGAAFFDAACRRGAEGVVSKQADAPYQSGRTRTWLKVKCLRRQEFVVIGFTDPSGARSGLGALLLGAHDEQGKLRYAGKVGTGFDAETLLRLRERLGASERPQPAAVGAPRARGQHWVEPRLVAEVAFTEWTQDGKIRHPTFQGLREDKPAQQVRFEREEQPPSPAPPLVSEVAGVRLSTPDRVYFPDVGVTKSELAQYYERVADRVLPGLAHRPLSLVRCPENIEGECFYQKRANRSIPANVPRVVVAKGREAYAMVTGLPSLIALVQVGVLEFHVWGARADRLDRPDLLILDLDPDEAVSWCELADTARLLRGLLEELKLVPFVRTTGGKGLHVVVPLARRSTWNEVKDFAQSIALALVRAAPERYTAEMSKAKRRGKIYVDYLRNEREATAIASWSVRARPGAPVAMPLAWDELDADERPTFTVRDAASRLDLPDPWAAFEPSRRPLLKAMRMRAAKVPARRT